MSRQRSVNSNTSEQKADIKKPTDESHLVFQLISNNSLIKSEVERQLLSGVYLDVQLCLDTGDLVLQHCKLESPEDFNNIFNSKQYGDILAEYYRKDFGLKSAINKLYEVPFAIYIVGFRSLMNQEFWVFLMLYALQAINKMKDSTRVATTQLIVASTYEQTTSTES